MENNIKVFNEYNIGDIVVSLNNKPSYRKIGDMFIILERSTPFTLYYAPYTSSGIFKDWRAATEVEIDAYNNGIKNIKDIPNFNDNGEMTNDELLEKAKKNYPIGTKIISALHPDTKIVYIINEELQWWSRSYTDIISGHNGVSVYCNGRWAKIIEKPKQELEISKWCIKITKNNVDVLNKYLKDNKNNYKKYTDYWQTGRGDFIHSYFYSAELPSKACMSRDLYPDFTLITDEEFKQKYPQYFDNKVFRGIVASIDLQVYQNPVLPEQCFNQNPKELSIFTKKLETQAIKQNAKLEILTEKIIAL